MQARPHLAYTRRVIPVPHHRLLHEPWHRAHALCQTGAPVFVLVNPVEFHGPHLSLHNDRAIAEGLVPRLHAAICPDAPLLVVDDLEVGAGAVPGPGSRDVRYRQERAVLRHTVQALAALGAQRVMFVTFHGAPMHNLALQEAADALIARGIPAAAPFHMVLRRMLRFERGAYAGAVAHLPAGDAARLLDKLHHDFHGGFFETSVALAVAPDTVSPRHVELPPCPDFTPHRGFAWASRMARRLGAHELAGELDLAATGTAWTAVDPFPGYTSEPALANAASGRWFVDQFVGEVTTQVRAVLYEGAEGPRPIMRWMPWVTLGGLLEPPTPDVRVPRRLTDDVRRSG